MTCNVMTRYELWHWHMIMILMICEWISQDQNIQEIHRKQPFQFVGTPPERSQWPRAVPSHGSFVAWSDIWTSALAHGGSWSSWESARGFCPVLSILRERERLPRRPNKILQLQVLFILLWWELLWDCGTLLTQTKAFESLRQLVQDYCIGALFNLSRAPQNMCLGFVGLQLWLGHAGCFAAGLEEVSRFKRWCQSMSLSFVSTFTFFTYIHPSIHPYIHTYLRPSVRPYVRIYLHTYHTIPYHTPLHPKT